MPPSVTTRRFVNALLIGFVLLSVVGATTLGVTLIAGLAEPGSKVLLVSGLLVVVAPLVVLLHLAYSKQPTGRENGA